MKKVLLFATVLVCVFQMNVFGQEQMGGRNFGLGLELGDYSGVTAKIWTTDINALSMGIGFDLSREYILIIYGIISM